MKILAAKMPTNPAAIHSIVSMKRSIEARMFAPHGLKIAGRTPRRADPAAVPACSRLLLRQGVVFGELGTKFGHRGVRVGTGLLDSFSPGLDQRLGGFLPKRRLLRRQFIDFVTLLRLDLVAAGVLELAPWFADPAGGLGVAVVVDRLFLTVR